MKITYIEREYIRKNRSKIQLSVLFIYFQKDNFSKIITYIRDKKRRNQEYRQRKTEAEIYRRRNADTDHDLFVCDTFNNRREPYIGIELHSC